MKLTANDVHLMMHLFVWPPRPLGALVAWEFNAAKKLLTLELAVLDNQDCPILTDRGERHVRVLLNVHTP